MRCENLLLETMNFALLYNKAKIWMNDRCLLFACWNFVQSSAMQKLQGEKQSEKHTYVQYTCICIVIHVRRCLLRVCRLACFLFFFFFIILLSILGPDTRARIVFPGVLHTAFVSHTHLFILQFWPKVSFVKLCSSELICEFINQIYGKYFIIQLLINLHSY